MIAGDGNEPARQHVDGFDFDKDAPSSPICSGQGDSYRDLPPDVWSPPGKMNVSPIVARNAQQLPSPDDDIAVAFPRRDGEAPRASHATQPTEKTPLLMDDVPPEIITPRHNIPDGEGEEDEEEEVDEERRRASHATLGSVYRSLVSDLRSEEESSKEVINNESEFYLASSMFKRGKGFFFYSSQVMP